MATYTELVTAAGTHTFTNKTIDADGTGNAISNLDIGNMTAAVVVLEAEGIGNNDNDTTLPTSAAVKDYVDAQVDTADALSELADTTIASLPSSGNVGHMLVYDNSNSWDNKTPSGDVSMTRLGAFTIEDDAVTYAKMQNVAADERILGNITADNSAVAELTKAQVLTMLNVADGAEVNVAPTTAQVLTALSADWTGDKVFGSQTDDLCTFTGHVKVTGDLTISGTTIHTATENITIEDSVMTLNSGMASGSTAADGGFIVERGTDGDTDGLVKIDGHNVGIGWDESAGYFKFSSGTSTSVHSFVANVGSTTSGTSDAPANDDVGPIGHIHVNTDDDTVFIRVA